MLMMRSASLKSACVVAVFAAIVLGDVACLKVQSNPRHSFPGRRVGGGTRGDCNARSLLHLVPESSVFAPGSAGTLGLVQGPSSNPFKLTVLLKPEDDGAPISRTFAATTAALILIRSGSVSIPTVWESSFECSPGEAVENDGLHSFIQSSSPPALSLLVPEPEADDLSVQTLLDSLFQRCGSTVPIRETLAQFGLSDVVNEDWPQQLPVLCPS